MLKHLLYFPLVLLTACGPSATVEDKLEKEPVPNQPKDTVVFPTRIKGEAGYIYIDAKGENGYPIVFAHSFGGSGEHWKNQVEHFKGAHRVVTFDFRGHGRSDSASADAYTPKDMAKDIETVADYLKLEKFVLVGHSMGGSAAVAYASEHPKKVAGLVLIGTPGKADPKMAEKTMAAIRSPKYQKVMDDYMDQLVKNGKPEVKTMVLQDFHKISRPISTSVTGAIFEYDPLPALEKYDGPLLIISTEKESQQPQALSKQVKRGNTTVVKGTSHWSQLDKPEEVNKIIDDFLQENKL